MKMKIPLFVYDYEARQHKLFPHPEMFTTLADGSLGFKFETNLLNYAKNDVFMEYRYLFEPNPVDWPKKQASGYEYRLKRQS